MTEQIGIKIENGSIVVNDAMCEETVTIKTCNNINLYVNDNEVPYGVNYPITSLDKIKYTSYTEQPSKSMKLIVSEDKLEARLIITYKNGLTYKLQDSPICKNISLAAEKVEIECREKYSIIDIKNYLNEQGVVYGIHINKILMCLNGTDENGIIVASGVKCIDDIPKRLKMIVDTKEKKLNNEDSEFVDYRNMIQMPNVESGQTIAVVEDRVEGNDGCDVFGNKLKKKTIKDPQNLIGSGCRIEGRNVIAVQPGRPMFKANRLIIQSVINVDAVNIETGNINFAGDVNVRGRVYEGSEIRCCALDVSGAVDRSKIISNGNIVIHSVVLNSVILAAEYNIERSEYLKVLKEVENDVNNIISETQILIEKTEGQKSIGTIVQFLTEQRYKCLTKRCISIITYNIKNGITDSEGLEFIRTKVLNMGTVNIKDIDEIKRFHNVIKDIIEDISREKELKVDCTVGYAQGSNIKATGNITITGSGCYQTNIYAGGNITFENEAAICRGGSLQSRDGNIKLSQVGSEASIKTVIECCNEKAVIEAKEAFANTTFIIGNRRLILKDNCRNIRLFIDHDEDTIKYELLKR
ncbi:flagellar assembly protein A [Inconstantimicrobium porci]|uniref:flagellar assembly protein A n=1 Tax=Inconstantimicrobium porci TaxID=2652291 RepID=UPI002408F7F8|nr:flagellar assembly protein A [Inconstantimicrobium porci]MDD6770449.1 FapA family protein [Inconstantimicrobium porci]